MKNIYRIILLLITLYKIISNLVTLIQCDSEICTKSSLCNDPNTDLSKVKYYNDGKCVGKDGKTTPYLSTSNGFGAATYTDDVAEPDRDKTEKWFDNIDNDLYPPSIRKMIEFWTFNADPIWGQSWLPIAIYCVFLALCATALGYYIAKGFANANKKETTFMLSPILMFGSINIGFIISGVYTKFNDQIK